jgi:aspartate dehydrogenase
LKTRVAIVGWGALAKRLHALLGERGSKIEIVALATRPDADWPKDAPEGAVRLNEPDDLAGAGIDIVVEAAQRSVVLSWGVAALTHCKAFALASTSAFADDGVFDTLMQTAERHNTRLLVPPGALGGIDALRAASILPLDSVCHAIIKPPAGWRGTEAERLCDLENLPATHAFFEGSARDAARRFPQNANVAAISALAGIGLDRTRVQLVADPAAQRNAHVVRAEGAFGNFEIRLENRPLAGNPKTSELTVLAMLRMLENETGRLVI